MTDYATLAEDTKNAVKPQKLSLRRKLGVVVGLMAFGFVAMVSMGLSNPRPSLREVGSWIQRHREHSRDLIHISEFVEFMGRPQGGTKLQPAWIEYN